jgi:hypothetical protein
MKIICLTIALFFWMAFTLILVCSLIGMLIMIPQENYTNYHKHHAEIGAEND